MRKEFEDLIRKEDKDAIKNKTGEYKDLTEDAINKIIFKKANQKVVDEAEFPLRTMNGLDFILAYSHYNSSNASLYTQAASSKIDVPNNVLAPLQARISIFKRNWIKDKELLLNDMKKGTKKSQYTSDNPKDIWNLLESDYMKRFMKIVDEVALEKTTKDGQKIYSNDLIDILLHMLKSPRQNNSWTTFRGAIFRGFDTKFMQDFIKMGDKFNFQRGEVDIVASKTFSDLSAINFNQRFTELTTDDMARWSNHLPKEFRRKFRDTQDLAPYQLVPKRIEDLHSRKDFATWLDVSNNKLISPEFGRLDTYEQLSIYYGYGGLDFGSGNSFGRIHSVMNPRYADKPFEQGAHTVEELIKADAEGALGIRASGLVSDRVLSEVFAGDNTMRNKTPFKQKTFLDIQTEKTNKQKKKVCLEDKKKGIK